MALAPIVPQLHMRQSSRLRMSRQSQPQGEKRYVREKEAGNLRDSSLTVAPPMRDPFGEVRHLDSQPPRPPCDSALMRVAAYGFVFFIYENPFLGSRYMHICSHNWRILLSQLASCVDLFVGRRPITKELLPRNIILPRRTPGGRD